MKPRPEIKKWRPGDLVLHDADPKTHAMLMEVLEIKGNLARTAYLDPHAKAQTMGSGRAVGSTSGWHSVELLYDPALFLRTREFVETVRKRLERKLGASRHAYSQLVAAG